MLERIQECLATLADVNVAYTKEYPPQVRPGVSADGLGLDARLLDCIQKQFPAGLYTHQREGIERILAGDNTVVATQTSSGKSLIFSTPTFQALLECPESTALFVFPQKALANDQLTKLTDMYQSLMGSPPDPNTIARYDGSVASDERREVRKHARFVLTNPDLIHLSFLQNPEIWNRFLSKLRYVIVDEAHMYRGIFGSSVAYIFRRLRAICDRYGSCPTFVSASATIADPKGHLKRLTGLEFAEIGPDRDGSTQGRKRIWLLRSHTHHYHLGRTLTRLFVDAGLSCLTFCPSRVSAERLLADLPDSEIENGKIRVYRAGLSSEEREEIEAGMRSGYVKGVFSTSALEIGIDIGALDVVVCVGLPNTMMSLWQRAGRVARAGKEGGIVFVAADTPLDSYFAENPEELLGRENEPLAVNLRNRRLVCHHLACAIQEAGDEDALDLEVLGEDIKHAQKLRSEGRLNDGIFYASDPHMHTPTRNADAKNYSIMVDGMKIGEIDSWHLLRECYPDAIYLHGGKPYRVAGILASQLIVRLRREWTRNRTVPVVRTSVSTRRVRAVTEYPSVLVKMADFDVTERLVAVQERNRSGETVRQYSGSRGLQPHRLPTEGICIETTSALTARFAERIGRGNLSSVVGAIARLIRGLFPVISGPCDLADFSTFSEIQSDRVSWYLYDQVYDGIDLAIQAYPRVTELLEKALDRVSSCDCQDDGGCFACVRNPDQEDLASKGNCMFVLDEIVKDMCNSEPKTAVFDVDVLEETDDVGVCPKCKASVSGTDVFCRNCGERLLG